MLPASNGEVGGSIDGVREPKNVVEMVTLRLAPYKESVALVQKQLRPWREFFTFHKPTGEQMTADVVVKRLQGNVQYFQGNYLVTLFVILGVMLLRSPSALIAFSLLGLSWGFFVSKNEDVTWKPVLFGMELNKTQRSMGMYVLSAFVFLLFAVDILFSVIGVGTVVIAAHGILNPGNFNADNKVGVSEEHQAVLDQL